VSKIRSVIQGTGGYLPEKILTNAELAETVETSDAWIRQRTGISERRIAAEGELTSDMAAAAARVALADAGLEGDDIDLIILATSTPDNTFPAAAVTVQKKLGIFHGAAFDVQAVCSGFVYALTVADAMLQAGQAKRALVIGAETFSRILDWTDRSTCVLFGDGAGAVVLERVELNGDTKDRGILTSHLRSDGRYKESLYVDGGPSSTGTIGHLRMDGREVFKHAVKMIEDVIADAFEACACSAQDIDWFVPHQANVRIIDATAKRFGIPDERVIKTVGKHGNTSAASIPLALWVASGDHRIKRGDLLLLESMGGGFTWASIILRW
jgi:3-oxoacyl-[acyl-carrier-protein] synthase-3